MTFPKPAPFRPAPVKPVAAASASLTFNGAESISPQGLISRGPDRPPMPARIAPSNPNRLADLQVMIRNGGAQAGNWDVPDNGQRSLANSRVVLPMPKRSPPQRPGQYASAQMEEMPNPPESRVMVSAEVPLVRPNAPTKPPPIRQQSLASIQVEAASQVQEPPVVRPVAAALPLPASPSALPVRSRYGSIPDLGTRELLLAIFEMSHHADLQRSEPLNIWSARIESLPLDDAHMSLESLVKLVAALAKISEMPAALIAGAQAELRDRLRSMDSNTFLSSAIDISRDRSLHRPEVLESLTERLGVISLTPEDMPTRKLVDIFVALHRTAQMPQSLLGRYQEAIRNRLLTMEAGTFLLLANEASHLPLNDGATFKQEMRNAAKYVMMGLTNKAFLAIANDKSPNLASGAVDEARAIYKALVEMDSPFTGWNDVNNQDGLRWEMTELLSRKPLVLDGVERAYAGKATQRVASGFKVVNDKNDVHLAFNRSVNGKNANAEKETLDVQFVYSLVVDLKGRSQRRPA